MIFHYAGKYNGDENSLPYKEHNPNAIPFKEPKDMKKYSLIANLGCVLIMIVLVIPFLLMGIKYIPNSKIQMVAGGICGDNGDEGDGDDDNDDDDSNDDGDGDDGEDGDGGMVMM